jgi:hypothetical protein
MRARILLVVVLALGLLGPSPVRADDRTAFLVDRLQYPPSAGHSDDFRVRASAALALGTSNDDGAVQPLCQALSDPNDAVRSAVAAALGRLARPSSVGCLKARLAGDSSAGVKSQIQKALDAIAANGGGPGAPAGPPKMVPNAKFYVALSSVANASGRAQADVDRIVLAAVRGKLDSLAKYQVAPANESADAARAVVARRNLTAYYLSLAVDKFDYSDGNLRVRVRVAVSSYPGKDLKGEVPAGITQTGVSPGDKASEDNLMGMAAGRAIELFAQNFQ